MNNNKPLSLLLVEDNPGDTDLTCERLAELPGFPFEVKNASNLADAVKVLTTTHIDAVVLDLNLPDSSGLETLQNLRRCHTEVAIVVLSGDGREELRRLALREGAQDFIAKSEPTARLLARSVLYACERQRALKGIRQLQRLVSENPDAMIVTDVDGRILFANRAAVELFDKSREELIGEALELSEEGQVKEIELKRGLETRSGEMRVASFSWDDRPGYLVVVRDTTERERMAAQLRQAQKMEAMGRLAGGIAHDFNNLLTAILGYGSMLTERLGEMPELRSHALHMVNAAEKAAALTRQLLAFGRKQVLNPRVLDLNEVLKSVVDLLRRIIGEDIQLLVSPCMEPCRVRADPSQLEQVILNLAINARDAMPEGGRLSFEVGRVQLDKSYVNTHVEVEPGPYVMLTVRDTGHGMDKATLAKLFEPFFTTKESGKGTGLGLATVYGIIKQSGGHIWVYSEPGLGATFKIYLPDKGSQVSVNPRTSAAAAALGGGETVLLVEDEDAVREFVKVTLLSAGYEVLSAEDGTEALAVAGGHEGPIDLVVTDVVMPGLDGPKLVEALRRARPETRVLFVSGYVMEVDAYRDALGDGVASLEKPFSGETLRLKVRQVLDGPPSSSSERSGGVKEK